jgi:hypothetical protein
MESSGVLKEAATALHSLSCRPTAIVLCTTRSLGTKGRGCGTGTLTAFVKRPESLREQTMAAYEVDWLLLLASYMNSLQAPIDRDMHERKGEGNNESKASMSFRTFLWSS